MKACAANVPCSATGKTESGSGRFLQALPSQDPEQLQLGVSCKRPGVAEEVSTG